ncbi:MFS transporter [Bacillus solimangrovi]|uniref:Tetracycline resistance protein n=1 Tax=Bacillus solimangrovi TaxID=1305675 RepID=A0A1E5LJK6_9BACI|nr:MFS transporter [Bacillus solimangrovi]OEH94264.1 tetracycline resistance protein [Bacillus solimangrovi]
MLGEEVQTKNEHSYLENLILPVKESRHFRFLWIGQLLSSFGSAIHMVILPLVVYSLTGSTMVMGITMTMYMIPNVLILPFSGLIVDKFNRINLMLLIEFIRTFLMITIMILLISDTLTIQILYVLVAINGLMAGLFHPAYFAVRAKIFVPKIRNAANALTQMSTQVVRLIGPALGGLIVSASSAAIGFGIDALTFFLSFICLLFLRDLATNHTPTTVKDSLNNKSNVKSDFLEGIKVLKSHPWLWITILAFSFITLCYTGIIVILIPWLFNIYYQFEPFIFGLCMTFSGLGAGLAALIFGMRQQWEKRGLMAYSGVIVSGLSLLAMPFVPWVPGLLTLMAIQGFGVMVFGLVWETSLQELVPEEMFGRVASLDMLGSYALLPLGYLLIGWLAESIGGSTTIIILSVITTLSSAILLCIPSIRKFN